MTIVSDRNNYDTRSQTMSGNQAGRSANRQADRQIDRADPKTQLLVDRQTKLSKIPTLSARRHSGILADRQQVADRQRCLSTRASRPTVRQVGQQTDIQPKLTHRHNYGQTDKDY
jgi:hypothetical protein